MILYHSSYTQIRNPDINHSRNAVDFGPGFYTTPILEQAKKWSMKFLKAGQIPIVSKYELDEKAFKKLKVKRFDSYSEDWLNFIIAGRKGLIIGDYDLIIGSVANDKVFNTIELFLDDLIDKDQAIKRLKYEKPNLQYCFKSQRAIDLYLTFSGSEIYVSQ